MSNKPCWYKRDSEAKWECGFFHQWSQSYEEFESGPGNFPAAIVEDARTEECHVVFAGHVTFSNDPPEGEEFIETREVDRMLARVFGDDYQLPSKRGLMQEANEAINGLTPESSDEEVEAAYQAMVNREGGDCSQGAETRRSRLPPDPTPHFDPRPSSRKFEPRLVWVADPSSLLVQVHPETIEVFNHSHEYVCQVRWIGGKMDYTQGGLPLKALEGMFMEAACVKAHQEGKSRPLQNFIDSLREERADE